MSTSNFSGSPDKQAPVVSLNNYEHFFLNTVKFLKVMPPSPLLLNWAGDRDHYFRVAITFW